MWRRRFKKFALPATTLIVSGYISLLFALGVIIGYLGTHFCHKKITKKRRLQSVNIKLGRWRIHFHHWLMGGVGLLLLLLFGILHLLPRVCLGIAAGLMFHDFYSDKDWYKVILKRQ